MALQIDQWKVETRPWGWVRLRERSGAGPSVYLNYRYGGPQGQERLDLQSVVMRSGGDEALSARVWRRIPLQEVEEMIMSVLSLAREAPSERWADIGRDALASFTAGEMEPPSLDFLDDYFDATADAVTLIVDGLPSGMIVADDGRFPDVQAPQGRITDDFLRDVAEAYRWASRTKRAPAPAISEIAKVPVRTVHRWIYEARKRSILPPARSGRAG